MNPNTFHVVIPLPPSLNHAYPTNHKTGKRFKSEALTTFKAEAILVIRLAARALDFVPPPKARYRLTLRHWFETPQICAASDASNRIKAAEDAIAEALGFNDSAVLDVRSIKAGSDRAAPRCEVELEIIV